MTWFEERLHADWRQGLRIDTVVLQERTGHQELLIFDNPDWGRVLTLDGVVQTTTGDEFCYHEMIVHVPILAHGAARDVLVIGGGDGGCLRETVKHEGVRQATLVEIDQGVIDLSRRYLPTISDGAFDHPKVRVIIADGAHYAASTDDRYDVVIVDSTDPIGPGAVLFTSDFYCACRRLLRPGGVLATQCGNPAIKPQELVDTQRDQAVAGFALVDYYLASVPTYIGGGMALGFATDAADRRTFDAAELLRRGVPTDLRYYTPEVHVGAFAHPAWMIRRVGR